MATVYSLQSLVVSHERLDMGLGCVMLKLSLTAFTLNCALFISITFYLPACAIQHSRYTILQPSGLTNPSYVIVLSSSVHSPGNMLSL